MAKRQKGKMTYSELKLGGGKFSSYVDEFDSLVVLSSRLNTFFRKKGISN